MPIPAGIGELSEEGHRYMHSSGVLMDSTFAVLEEDASHCHWNEGLGQSAFYSGSQL